MKSSQLIWRHRRSGWAILGQRYVLGTTVLCGAASLPTAALWSAEPGSPAAPSHSSSVPAAEKQTGQETMTEVEFGHVVRFKEWLKQKHSETDRRMPQVVDLIVSPRTSSVLATVEHDPGQEKPWIATLKPIPAEKSPEVEDVSAKSGNDAAKEKGAPCESHLSAGNADDLPGLVVKQIVAQERSPEKLRSALQNDSPIVAAASLKDLLGRPIRGLDGELIAKVVDFGIAPQQQHVAYAIVKITAQETGQPSQGEEANSQKTYAIPLAAFVHSEQADEWKMELTAEEVAKQEPIDKGQTPSEISRGWIEYLSVRYGRSTTGGIQPQVAEKK